MATPTEHEILSITPDRLMEVDAMRMKARLNAFVDGKVDEVIAAGIDPQGIEEDKAVRHANAAIHFLDFLTHARDQFRQSLDEVHASRPIGLHDAQRLSVKQVATLAANMMTAVPEDVQAMLLDLEDRITDDFDQNEQVLYEFREDYLKQRREEMPYDDTLRARIEFLDMLDNARRQYQRDLAPRAATVEARHGSSRHRALPA